jgi:disulfide bond formation protein DsbB
MIALTPRNTALVVALGAAITLGVAYYFQYVLGYSPCALCLWQRWAYYIGIPLALIAAATGRRDLLLLVALVFAANALLGLYHAGIEWKFWAGPATCSAGAAASSSGNLIEDLQNTRIVPCDAAPWRFLSLSFAGWSMAICAALGALALAGTRRSA